MVIGSSEIWTLLESIPDPEIPVISIVDLGIIRRVERVDDIWEIDFTPTYSGCPAMDLIELQISSTLLEHGLSQFKLSKVISPAWTTKWLTESGKQKLRTFGIAPPVDDETDKTILFQDPPTVQCPKCESADTKMVSAYGSTPCKSHYTCNHCQEPFDYFKCH